MGVTGNRSRGGGKPVIAAATAAAALAGLLSLLRWLRISQREHYIAGSCLVFARRWFRSRFANTALVGLSVSALAVGVWAAVANHHAVSSGAVVAGAASAGLFPWPMSLLGRPRFRWTRRASTLATASAVVGVAGVLALRTVTALPVAALALLCLVPAIVDLSASLVRPSEVRLLERHRSRAEARLQSVAPAVIAVTGSWGKTSTKEHVRDLLSPQLAVVASPASFNNTAGLCRTINDHLVDGTEILVAEMGMYRPGEIRAMCSWVRPQVAVITGVGPMHLERAGSMDKILEAKAEILERADVGVLWVDDPRLAALADSSTNLQIIRVGSQAGGDLDVEVQTDQSESAIWSNGNLVGACPVESGVHPSNVGCAVGAALAIGALPELLHAPLSTLQGPRHRMAAHLGDSGLLTIDDTFSANPKGVVAALGLLGRKTAGHKAVITPGLVELGVEQFRANAQLARTVVESGATLVVVGRTNRSALLSGAEGNAVTVASRQEARNWVQTHLGEGDGVLWENDLPDHYP